ncbi:MAG: 50S ribosomal protein L29 [Nitrospirota bacterium]
MKVTELRTMTIDELKNKEKELKRELFNLRAQQVMGEIENPMRIRQVRKNIARVKTIITEKGLRGKG